MCVWLVRENGKAVSFVIKNNKIYVVRRLLKIASNNQYKYNDSIREASNKFWGLILEFKDSSWKTLFSELHSW